MKPYLSVTLVVASLLLAACGGAAAQPPAGPIQEVAVTAIQGFSFNPQEITVQANRPVRVTYRNDDYAIHDWAVMKIPFTNKTEKSNGGHPSSPDPKTTVHVTADSGQTGTVEFTPTRPGRYEIICSISGHKQIGMVGALIVK